MLTMQGKSAQNSRDRPVHLTLRLPIAYHHSQMAEAVGSRAKFVRKPAKKREFGAR
jgi:hypothetical protein